MKLSLRNTLTKGKRGEKLAIQYLVQQGLKLVAQNVRSPYGEIDGLMRDGEAWVFLEVRYRQSKDYGGGLESVDYRKQQKLIKTAEHYMQSKHKVRFDSCRFDIIELSGDLSAPDIIWIQDAFQVNS